MIILQIKNLKVMIQNYSQCKPVNFSQVFMFATVLLLVATNTTVNAQVSLLNPLSQTQFVQSLPDPSVINTTAGGTFNVSISQFYQALGLRSPSGDPLYTKVWGYNGSYPGPTIVARKNVATDFFWHNNLEDVNQHPLPH